VAREGAPSAERDSRLSTPAPDRNHPLVSAQIEGPGRLKLSWTLDPSSLRVQHTDKGRSVHLPGFGQRPAADGTLVPYRIEYVAIPEGVTPRLSAASKSAAVLGLGTIGYFRDQRFVEVRVSPARIEDGEVSLTPNVEAVISWDEIPPVDGGTGRLAGGGVEPADSPIMEPLYDRLFVNAEQGRGFRSRWPDVAGRARPAGVARADGSAPAEADSTAAPSDSSSLLLTGSASAGEAELVVPTQRLRLEVTRSGLVRVTQTQLAAVTPDLASVDPRTLRMTYRNVELPLFVSGEADGNLGSADYLEFFGEPPADTAIEPIAQAPTVFSTIWQLRDFTDTNVYFIDSVAGTRLRPAVLNGNPNRNFPLSADWPAKARLEGSGRFRPFGGNDPWSTCPRVQSASCGGVSCCAFPANTFSVPLPGLAPSTGPASVLLVLQGWNGGAHRVDVLLNGAPLTTTPIEWTGLGEVRRAFPVANSALAATTGVGISLPGNGTGLVDQVALDFIEVGYRRLFTAGGGELLFEIPDANARYQVGEFTVAPTAWYDISLKDPATGQPISRRISNAQVTAVSGGFQTRFELQAEGLPARRLLVAAPEAVRPPAAMARLEQTPLIAPSDGADLVVIAHPSLIDLGSGSALSDYLQLRQSQGLRTRVVSVLDIFDQFSGGLPEVNAIRDFLASAYTTWTAPPPSYVLFLGDGSSDYKNRLALPAWRNQVPAPIHTVEDALFAFYSADTWYAAFRGGDFLPDILYGRISAASLLEAEQVLRKIVRYETAPPAGEWRSLGVFVSGDGHDSTQDSIFPADSDAVAAWFVPPFTAEKLYYTRAPYNGTDARTFETDLLAAFDRGAAIFNYVGHGNFTIWDGNVFLQNSDVARMTNTDRLPVIFNSTCLMGGYHLDVMESLGEVLVESTADTGGIAVLAPSGLSNVNISAQVNGNLFQAMMGHTRMRTLGEIVMAARVALAQQNSIFDLQNLTLLGDPSLRVTLPAPRPPTGAQAAASSLRVDLSWTPSADPVAGYHVYRTQAANPAVGSGAIYTRLTPAPVSGATFADTTVKNTTTYGYTLTAVDASGFESAYSNFNTSCGVSAADCLRATPYNPVRPASPQGVSVRDAATGFRIQLQWLPNSEPDLKTYTVIWGTSPGTYTGRRDVGLVTSVNLDGFQNGVQYYLAVTATNTSDAFVPPGSTTPLDTESAPSAEATAIPTLIQGIRPPAMIRDLRIERDPGDPASVRLSWSKPLLDIYGGVTTVTGFQVHRSEAIDFRPTLDTLRATLSADVTSWMDPGAFADTRSFFYLVLASDGAGRLSSAGRAFPTGINDLRVVEERDAGGVPTGFVVLSWGAVSRDIEGQPTVVDHYEVYGAATPFSRDQLGSVGRLTSVASLTARLPVPAASRFFYSVVAVDRRGNVSPF